MTEPGIGSVVYSRSVKRYFNTHFAQIAIYTLIVLVVGYLIAGAATWRLAAAIGFAFIVGVRLGFSEACTRFQSRIRKRAELYIKPHAHRNLRTKDSS